MNNVHNPKLPEYQEKYGSDWSAFKAINQEESDLLVAAIWRIYSAVDIDRMSPAMVDKALSVRRIEYSGDESITTRKTKLRFGDSKHKQKSLDVFYLDIQEAIVGTRGVIYLGEDIFGSAWGETSWSDDAVSDPDMAEWGGGIGERFKIYIDCKTTDDALLDSIVSVYRLRSIIPAFYTIYLVDANINIVRTV